jgi:hypothetical protein
MQTTVVITRVDNGFLLTLTEEDLKPRTVVFEDDVDGVEATLDVLISHLDIPEDHFDYNASDAGFGLLPRVRLLYGYFTEAEVDRLHDDGVWDRDTGSDLVKDVPAVEYDNSIKKEGD